MPPRIPILQVGRICRVSSERSGTPVGAKTLLVPLFAALSIQLPPSQAATPLLQTRSASILSNLRDNPGAYNKRIRKGRGPSSGYGKTSGRGHKGQGQHGKVKPWFQGGQTPLIFKHGRMGFVNNTKLDLAEVNLSRLQAWIDARRIDPKKPIGPKELIRSKLVNRYRDGIKLLTHTHYDKAELRQPINIQVSRASAKAIEAVEAAGGKIVTRFYTKDSIRRLLKGESIDTAEPLPVGKEHVRKVLEKARQTGFKYRLPDPTGRWDIEYYRDPAHRGYLSHQIKPGESPSLFFRVPGEMTAKGKTSKKSRKDIADDKKLFDLR